MYWLSSGFAQTEAASISVTDLPPSVSPQRATKNGKQPMMDIAGNTAVVFNGEIYGYKDIKPNLNYPFSTDCDTEVILALYQKYGRNMIQHLPGMFAFALWDSKNKSLYCARDRFGEKPFYYAWGNNGEFIFASEIKAILASEMVEPVLDYQQLNYYLCYSYIGCIMNLNS